MLSIIHARLRRPRLLVQAALTPPEVRRQRRTVRRARQDQSDASWPRVEAWPGLREAGARPAVVFQPARSRRR